ncbi:MAG TPA: hypothetical protein VG939_16550 [Caulobacteraceae bacterium]|nr:hypothetical protein [Caulobacteraceae bacterium]
MRRDRDSRNASGVMTGFAVAAGGAAWFWTLMSPIWEAARFGPICGHGAALVAHCPSCYAALALVAAGLAAAAHSALTPQRAPVRVRR